MISERGREDGFTLIEVLIALVLFSLIGVAGFSLLNAIVGVQARTDQRLERLAELQRAMHVVTLDFQQIQSGTLLVEGASASLRRGSAGQSLTVRYDFDQGSLRRTLEAGAGERAQTLISNVTAFRWLFFAPGQGWLETWPPEGETRDGLPAAISAEVTLGEARGGLSGALRRVVRLPAEAAL